MRGFNILRVLFIINFASVTPAEHSVTTTESSDICDIDSSCNSTVTAETQTEKVNSSEKWKYNVSDGTNLQNETIIDIVRLNETNTNLTIETDSSNQVNKSTAPSESKTTNTKYKVHLGDDCFCDKTRGSCDINCCCDRDCLTVNRDVFKYCIGVDHFEEDKLCHSKILNSPFLCVVKDNLYSRHFYPQHQIAEEVTNVDKLLKNREVYGWPSPSLPLEEDADISEDFKEYEIGSHIWILDESSQIKPFRLPKSTISSRDCSNKESVKFLQDFEETCTHRLENSLASECERNSSIFNALKYFTNFTFVANPIFSNYSITPNCSENCVNVTPFLCESDNPDTCTAFNVSKIIPSFAAKTNVCSRAVTSVHYKIVHNGTEGILAVHLYLQQTNITFKPNLLWSIPFRMSHQWTNQNQSYKLSGMLGYEPGKPIITGYKILLTVRENKYTEVMRSSLNVKNWLTVFRTNNAGSCLKQHRYNILFQENLYAHCFVKVPPIRTVEGCETFQNEIFSIIFGAPMNLSNVYISTLGDPNFTDKKKWAPVIIDFPSAIMTETCHGIVTSIKMVILYASVGEHNSPQQTIAGVKVTGSAFHKNVSKYESIKLSFAVNFYDVTSPPLRIFAEPPTYEVKLPTDFFYPFFSGASSVNASLKAPLVSVLLIFYFFVRFLV